jgi:hypothetical protein
MTYFSAVVASERELAFSKETQRPRYRLLGNIEGM